MISSADNRVTYTGDGTTTTFAVPFKFLADGDLVVVRRTTTRSLAHLAYEAAPPWAPSTAYVVDDVVHGVVAGYTDYIYRCTAPGTSPASSAPDWELSPTGTGLAQVGSEAVFPALPLLWTFVTIDGRVLNQYLSTHYTVSGAGDEGGGSITFLTDDYTAPEINEQVVIYNNPSMTQLVDYVSGDAFPAETHELALDRVTIQQKRTREMVERSLSLPDTDIDGAGAYDANQNKIQSLATPTLVGDAANKTYVDTAVTNAAFSAPTGIVATGSSETRDLADRWAQQYNVKDFGADDTGLVDATTAIQEALDACDTAGGGTVYFPKGDYLINAALTIGDNTCLTGEPTAWIKSSTIDIHILVNKDQVSGNSNITLDGINIDCSATTAPPTSADDVSNGAFFERVTWLSVRNCRFVNTPQHSLKLSYVELFDVSHNEFDGPGDVVRYRVPPSEGSAVTQGTAIHCRFIKRGTINANRITNPYQMAVFVWGSASGDSYEISITNNYIENCKDNGIRLQPDNVVDVDFDPSMVRDIVVSNNRIFDQWGSAIRLNGRGVVCSGNVIGVRKMAPGRTIAATFNTTPVRVQTSTSHGYADGTEVGITGTGIDALDGKFFYITNIDADEFSLDGTTAPGSTASAGTSGCVSPNGFQIAGVEDCIIDSNIIMDFTQQIVCLRVRPDSTGSQNERIKGLVISNNILRSSRNAGQLRMEAGSVAGTEVITDVTIRGNHIMNDGVNALTSPAVLLKGAVIDKVKIDGNNISTGDGAAGGHYGIHCNGTDAGSSISDISITNNTLWDNDARAIYLQDVTGFTVAFNRAFDTRGSKDQDYGLRLDSDNDQGLVIGNDFRGNNTRGIANATPTGATNVQCFGNLGGEHTLAAFTVGGGQSISEWLSATASLTFSAADDATDDEDITVTGAAQGDTVLLAPASNTSAPAGVTYYAYVHSTNTVRVRCLNKSGGAFAPGAQTFRADVIKHPA